MHRSMWLLAAILVATSVYLVAQAAGAATFSNSAQITINDSGTPPTAATPYPSQIAVLGVTGTVTDVNVTLTGLSHVFPDDVDVLLAGPGGQSVLLMSDAGFEQGASNLTFTVDDEAAAFLPETGELASGFFKPSNHPEETIGCAVGLGSSSDPFAPAPAGPSESTLASFDGTSANGTWSLYVIDDCRSDAGSISGGWSLDITTAGPDPADEITDLKAQVSGLGLATTGISTALNSKLDEAIMALAADYTPGACDSLRAFQSQVAAQRRKKLSQAQAEQLTDAANEIRTVLDC